jgi:hypothetical protein
LQCPQKRLGKRLGLVQSVNDIVLKNKATAIEGRHGTSICFAFDNNFIVPDNGTVAVLEANGGIGSNRLFIAVDNDCVIFHQRVWTN